MPPNCDHPKLAAGLGRDCNPSAAFSGTVAYPFACRNAHAAGRGAHARDEDHRELHEKLAGLEAQLQRLSLERASGT